METEVGQDEIVDLMRAHFAAARRLRDGAIRYPAAREGLLKQAAEQVRRISVLGAAICGGGVDAPATRSDIRRQIAGGQ